MTLSTIVGRTQAQFETVANFTRAFEVSKNGWPGQNL